jgi:hypothetical protein
VKASVSLDVVTHARLCAAAALRGCSNSTFIEDAITEALRGIVVVDRRGKPADSIDPPTKEVSAA